MLVCLWFLALTLTLLTFPKNSFTRLDQREHHRRGFLDETSQRHSCNAVESAQGLSIEEILTHLLAPFLALTINLFLVGPCLTVLVFFSGLTMAVKA